MYALTLILATLGVVAAAPSNDIKARQVAAVASVNRYAGGGCTGTVCDIAGSGNLHVGCNAITDSCQSSLNLAYMNPGCKVTVWTDSLCQSTRQFANVTGYDCYQLGPPIKGISVDC